MADITPEQVQQKIQQICLTTAYLQQRQAGEVNLFNAAATLANRKDMDALRERLHGTLDEMLDANASMYMLVKMTIETPRS